MVYEGECVRDLKIAYIGGGSRGWAWTLMNDLKKSTDLAGQVFLYDIDLQAAENNAIIGNRIDGDNWQYHAVRTIDEALTGADFVVVSILPGTFDEMAVDVHAPEKYGIYQSVGDTAGPGGFIRALRTVPMMRRIAAAVRRCCPEATVINYTNPMAVSIGALYREFPRIKAYGCCHEVFGTQKLLARALQEFCGIETQRQALCTNVVGVNHFTWFTSAKYRNLDIFPIFEAFVDRFYDTGYNPEGLGNWMNNSFKTDARVRMDLFRRFGYIAAAGDRHLAEFMDNTDYLASPECVSRWAFALTSVQWRKQNLQERLARSARLLSGEEVYTLRNTGEEGVQQIRALVGLDNMITNVNLPNRGQIENLPLGAVVETNATFRADGFAPVHAGAVPENIYPMIRRAAEENTAMLDAAFSLDLGYARRLFAKLNMLKTLTQAQKEALFDEMIQGTKEYLTDYKE